MPLAESQIEYNNLLLGYGTPFKVKTITGLSPPDGRQNIVDNAIQHGAFVAAEFIDPRVLGLHGIVTQPVNFENALDLLRSTFVPTNLIKPLRFMLGGVVRKIYCIPTRRSWDYTVGYKKNFTDFAVELLAGDPRIYSDVEINQIITGPEDVNNAGVFPTPWVAEISDPATNPRLTNNDTDEYIEWVGSVLTGETLTIDSDASTILLENISRYDGINPDSTWFDLKAGNTSLTYTGGGSCELFWNSAWI